MTQPKKPFQYPTPGEPTAVADYEFEPIQGYPMLHWQGKRPFTSTHYYPAQRREVHGPEVEGWRNKLYWGDNLQVMSHLLKEFRGQVQLVYIDPPFDSKAEYKKTIALRGREVTNDHNAFEEKQYSDIWTNDEYLQYMYERLTIIRELLSDNGSMYLHCDWHKSHHLRCLLDEIFGPQNFKNDIVWQRFNYRADGYKFGAVHDTILFYTKSSSYTYNQQYLAHKESYIRSHFRPDKTGRMYRLDNLSAPAHGKQGKALHFGDQLIAPPVGTMWRYTQEGITELWEKGRIVLSEKGGVPQVVRYLDELKGEAVHSIWTDSRSINSQSKERTDYPTQKPESLLERIIETSSNPGDLVFDCFCGSGTTQAVAMRLGRRFLGADINLGAIQITTKRLLTLAETLQEEERKKQEAESKMQQAPLDLDAAPTDPNSPSSSAPVYRLPSTVYLGFEVYNVNHYDIFRNPVEARDLLLQALEVQRLPAGSLFDGEKDGRLVKLMPVNRIATRADLNELISGFDYRGFEQRRSADPTKPVERITLVCMGHVPDLAAALQHEAQPYTLDVDVVDILRDRADLQFKRDAEAEIRIEDGVLVIRRFYPLNLLQKLSLQKEAVSEWRELVESVMIDWNYDGAALEPHCVDIPEKNALVAGRYPIPPDAGTIRVKITDLLSESLEVEVRYG